jgi:rare lipoprotein A
MKKIITIFSLFLAGCTTESVATNSLESSHKLNTKSLVLATWYQSGHRTANGERFNPDGMTVAHKKLPFNTMLRVTNPKNGNSILVRVNDRGPFVKGRELDLARGAARAIGMKGTEKVHMEVLPNR